MIAAAIPPAALPFERFVTAERLARDVARLAAPLPMDVRRRVEAAINERQRTIAALDARLAAEPAEPGVLERDVDRYRRLCQRVSLPDVIGTLTGEPCRPGGQRLWRCRCPGHMATKPVLVIWPDNHAHCRRCRWHGDRLRFIGDFFEVDCALAALDELDRLFGPA